MHIGKQICFAQKADASHEKLFQVNNGSLPMNSFSLHTDYILLQVGLKSIELGNIDSGYMNRGHIYFAQGKLDDAYKCYKTSLSNFDDKKIFFADYNEDFRYLKQYGVSYDNYMKMKDKLVNSEQ